MTSHADSRFDDENIKQEIQKLIIDEEDPKEKLRLLMLLQLNTSLISNVVAVRNLTQEFKEHRVEFETHVEAHEKIYNTGRGLVWGMMILLGIIQVGSSFILAQFTHKSNDTYVIAVEAAVNNRLQDEKIKSLEERVTVNGARISNNSNAETMRVR